MCVCKVEIIASYNARGQNQCGNCYNIPLKLSLPVSFCRRFVRCVSKLLSVGDFLRWMLVFVGDRNTMNLRKSIKEIGSQMTEVIHHSDTFHLKIVCLFPLLVVSVYEG